MLWLQECDRDTSDTRTLAIASSWPRQHSSLALTGGGAEATVSLHFDILLLGVPHPHRFSTDVKLRTVGASDRIWLQGRREALKREYMV